MPFFFDLDDTPIDPKEEWVRGVRTSLFFLLVLLFLAPSSYATEADIDPGAVLKLIAGDITALKPEFPQLADFTIPNSFAPNNYEITYRYNARDPQGGGGWSGGTPSPRDDGLWFYISLHSPSSTRQIHTQPMVAPTFLGPYKFQFLLKEGKKTRSLNAAMWAIFRRHGVVDGALQ